MKRRLRAPSPALVISMIALFVALGGTSLAATKVLTTKHKDAKQDTKLVKKLAPSLSVKHAKSADNATNATHASSADSATNATNATNATHATSAGSATNATNATNATTALSPGTLAPGKTEVGEFGFGGAGGSMMGHISFPFPLASAPTLNIINSGDTVPSGCTGSVSDPGATPGNLCIFVGYTEGGLVMQNAWEPVSGQHVGSRLGETLWADGGGSGTNDISGTWAVTAPIPALRHESKQHRSQPRGTTR